MEGEMSIRCSLGAICAAISLSLFTPSAADARVYRFFDPEAHGIVTVDPDHPAPRQFTISRKFLRQIVEFPTSEKPGTVIVDTGHKFLYFVLPGEEAIRYGIGVGREGFGWTGVVHVGAKQEWPTWTPPVEMIERRPDLAEYETGMPGGEDNPLGARALYLFDGPRDTQYRIHGTNEPWSIGLNMSSGCIRMMNDDVVDLYQRVGIGTKVIVI
jgi:lipoprotein-anchoring transpeptidase ErfK/SrfK